MPLITAQFPNPAVDPGRKEMTGVTSPAVTYLVRLPFRTLESSKCWSLCWRPWVPPSPALAHRPQAPRGTSQQVSRKEGESNR